MSARSEVSVAPAPGEIEPPFESFAPAVDAPGAREAPGAVDPSGVAAPPGAVDSPSPPRLVEGDELAPGYEVIEHLSRSRVLDVYDVWSEERDCRCVAKTLRPERPAAGADADRLLAEGRLLERLTHPHLVRAYDTLSEPAPAVILETLPGATLAYMLGDRTRRLPLGDVFHLGTHLCSAIAYLHRQGYLHLDLKPSNVVSDCGTAKVIDLSIARPPGPIEAGVGTRAYLAPEQARGDRVDAAADVWGIGVVLYEATTGRPAFSPALDGYEQLDRRAEPLRTHRRVPAPFGRAIDACLEPEPARRPSVEELRETLEDLL